MTRPLPHLCSLAIVTLLCVGCDDGPSATSSPEPDGEVGGGFPSLLEAGPRPSPQDAGPLEVDAGGVDLGPPRCLDDVDCGDRALCGEDGLCAPALQAPFVRPPLDGVTRAAAASFDIVPEYLETWTERAGEGCPDNRRGRFDGQVRRATPEGACVDGFDDADGDGLFDAVWLGGDEPGRAAHGVELDNPPAGRVLLLTRDEVIYLLVTLDVYALDAARVRDLQRRLQARLGLRPARIAVHAVGLRSGPDAVGLWGPGLGAAGAEALVARATKGLGLLSGMPAAAGVDEGWWASLAERCAAAARQAGTQLQPVVARSAAVELLAPSERVSGPVWVPDADGDGMHNDATDLAEYRAAPSDLARDSGVPGQRVGPARALLLESAAGGAPVVVVAEWNVAAALTYDAGLLSADFVGAARRALEARYPGAVGVWLTGAAADTLRADPGAWVPEVSADGRAVDAARQPAESVSEPPDGEARALALGRLLAGRLAGALDEERPGPVNLRVSARYAWVPLSNPRYGLAARLGILGYLDGWLSGRVATNAWSSGPTTPACGGLGCLRYRLDRLDLGPVTWLLTPGALSTAYVSGRGAASVSFDDLRLLRDLDVDGVPDAEDPEIRVEVRDDDRDITVHVTGPANPQRLEAIEGLESDRVWLIGRSNGGVGSLRPPTEAVNVFEGQLGPLQALVHSSEGAGLELCALGFPCVGPLSLGELVAGAADAQPARLADITAAQELWVVGDPLGEERAGGAWVIRDEGGEIVVAGETSVVGPLDRIFMPGVDLAAAGVRVGMRVEAASLSEPLSVGGLRRVELRWHPNAADSWTAATVDGGDLIYNVACDLLFDGACPHRRAVPGEDPNQSLPRTP